MVFTCQIKIHIKEWLGFFRSYSYLPLLSHREAFIAVPTASNFGSLVSNLTWFWGSHILHIDGVLRLIPQLSSSSLQSAAHLHPTDKFDGQLWFSFAAQTVFTSWANKLILLRLERPQCWGQIDHYFVANFVQKCHISSHMEQLLLVRMSIKQFPLVQMLILI